MELILNIRRKIRYSANYVATEVENKEAKTWMRIKFRNNRISNNNNNINNNNSIIINKRSSLLSKDHEKAAGQ